MRKTLSGAALAAVVLVSAACGGEGEPDPALTDVDFKAHLEWPYVDVLSDTKAARDECVAHDIYEGVKSGAPVTLVDAAGEVVASENLRLEPAPNLRACVWTASFSSVDVSSGFVSAQLGGLESQPVAVEAGRTARIYLNGLNDGGPQPDVKWSPIN